MILKNEKSALEGSLKSSRRGPNPEAVIKSLIDEIMSGIRQYNQIFEEGTNREKKEFIRQFVDKIELDPEEKRALIHIRKFPAPKSMDAGNLSIELVAGAGFEPATFGL